MVEISFHIGVFGLDDEEIDDFFNLYAGLLDDLDQLEEPGDFGGVDGLILLVEQAEIGGEGVDLVG